METATSIDFEQRQREYRKRGFEQRMEQFLRDFGPDDHYDRAHMERELISLVMQIYQEAQAPILDHLSKIAMAMPFPPTIIEKK